MAWLDDLLAALAARDSIQQGTRSIIEKYTELADRIPSSSDSHDTGALYQHPTSLPDNGPAYSAQELLLAQKHRVQLQDQVAQLNAEVQQRVDQAGFDGVKIRNLSLDNKSLTTKLRDREEEIKGKAKLLEDIHDETVALTLQLNILEESNKNLKQENQDLVDRWMARVGKEADAMNDASAFR